MTASEFFTESAALGRAVRTGSWADQAVGTYTKTVDAIDRSASTEAVEYLDFFLFEANVIYGMYTQINPDLREFMAQKGMSAEAIADADARVIALLHLPSGAPFVRAELMEQVESAGRECRQALLDGQWDAAREHLEVARETWRRVKDRDGDHSYGLIDAIVANLGEAAIGEMWDAAIRPLFNWRYSSFDIANRTWAESLDQLMMVACESMRAHLVGLDRTGDFELTELDDRYVLRFDPCGSGGRSIRGDSIEGTPSRMEAPYNWTVSREPHSWNHGSTGIGHYCTHCIRLMEEMPMEAFGYPVRVVDPPRYPDADPERRQYCQWQMFKDPTAVPEEYYTRVGRTKPTVFGSAALAEQRAAQDATEQRAAQDATEQRAAQDAADGQG